MSFEHGWAAVHLDMPPRVPRTEYSLDFHWPLIKAVTGVEAGNDSPDDERLRAAQAIRRAWNYDFFWGVLINSAVFGDMHTDMGHAEYAVDGADRRDTIRCPFSDVEEILSFDPTEAFGAVDHKTAVDAFNKHYRQIRRDCPDEVATTGVYITMISGFIDLFGWDMLLMALGSDPQRFGEMANRYARWMQGYMNALADSESPVVMIHDDMVWTSGAFVRPDWYRTYVFPNFKRYLQPLRDAGKIIAFTSDGTYTEFFDDLVECGVHGFCLEPTNDMAYIAERYGRTHFFIGNADTRILLRGSREQIRAEVQRCMDIGKHCPGFIMSVGNHIPPNTPVENAIYYNDVYEELSRR